jgi:glycosyltransferase involved in cell wall biosynthesis
MKVLLVHNAYQLHGGEDGVYQRERDLLRTHGHEVIEYQRTNDEIKHYSTLQKLTLGARVVWSSGSKREIAELLHKTRPDLVHVHNTFMVISPSIYSAIHEQQIPVVQTLHNYRLMCPVGNFTRDGKPCEDCTSGIGLGNSILHGCYRNSRATTASVAAMLAVHRAKGTYTKLIDHFIALTEFSKSKLLMAGLDPAKVTVKPNFMPNDPGERMGDGGYALYVGRLEPEKGVRTVLEAWRQLPEPVPLRIAGTGPLEDEFKAAAATMPHLQLLGHLPFAQLMEVVKGARFTIFSSLMYENFPLSIVEAFACGVPVIGSDRGATAEIVKHDLTGLLFRPGDPTDLAAKVWYAWKNPEPLKRMGKQARREYETKYTAEKNYRMLKDIYDRVLARNARAEAIDAVRGQVVPV